MGGRGGCHRRQGGPSRKRENLIGSDDVKKIIKTRCQKMYIHYRDMEVTGEYNCCFQAVTMQKRERQIRIDGKVTGGGGKE